MVSAIGRSKQRNDQQTIMAAIQALQTNQFDYVAALARLVTITPEPTPAQAQELFNLFLDLFLEGRLKPTDQFITALTSGIVLD